MSRMLVSGLAAIVVLAAACSRAGQGSPSVDASAADALATSDPGLRAVSLSESYGDSADAMALCGVGEHRDLVSGAAHVMHAKDLPKYVRLSGNEPEIQTDAPAWVVAYQGVVRLPVRGLRYAYVDQIDPTCVVIDGESSWFTTGEIRNPDGTVIEPSLLPAPAGTLPPLGS